MEINRQSYTSWIYNTLHFTTISNTVAYSDILGDLGLIPSGVPPKTSLLSDKALSLSVMLLFYYLFKINSAWIFRDYISAEALRKYLTSDI